MYILRFLEWCKKYVFAYIKFAESKKTVAILASEDLVL